MNRQTGKPTNHESSGGGSYSYRNLDVWQRSQQLAVDVIRLIRGLKGDVATDVVAKQLIASAASVGANIAEGHGRFTRPAYRQHLVIAKGSASEVGSWLDLLERIEAVAPEQVRPLQLEADSLIGLLKHKIRSLDAADAAAKGQVREESVNYETEDRFDD